MGIRITPLILSNQVLGDIQNTLQRLSVLQERLATGRQINRPSDDAVGARRALDLRSQISALDQYLINIRDGDSFLDSSATAIQATNDVIIRAQELTTRGLNGTLSQQNRDTLAEEINSLLETALSLANTLSGDKYVFSGTRTRTAPYTATRVGGEISSVTYTGNTDQSQVQVANDSTVAINLPGSNVFQKNEDIFNVLIGIRDELRAGSLNDTRLQQLDTARQDLLDGVAQIGAIQNRLELFSNRIEDAQLDLERLRSTTEEADFASTVVQLNNQETAYRAALDSGARLMMPSLLDYLG